MIPANFPNLRFLHDWILVKRLPLPESTKSGLILPTSAVELPQLATVIHVGPKNPEGITPGSLVLLPKYAGVLFPIYTNGLEEDYYLFHTKEILALITD